MKRTLTMFALASFLYASDAAAPLYIENAHIAYDLQMQSLAATIKGALASAYASRGKAASSHVGAIHGTGLSGWYAHDHKTGMLTADITAQIAGISGEHTIRLSILRNHSWFADKTTICLDDFCEELPIPEGEEGTFIAPVLQTLDPSTK